MAVDHFYIVVHRPGKITKKEVGAVSSRAEIWVRNFRYAMQKWRHHDSHIRHRISEQILTFTGKTKSVSPLHLRTLD